MKINLTTLGCPKNIVDSEILLGGLKGEDIEIVENPLDAETIILNTCGFIQGAKEESIDAILQAVELKKRGDCEKVFVTGCLSQRYQDELLKEIPEIDHIFGVNQYPRLKEVLDVTDTAIAQARDQMNGPAEYFEPYADRILTTPSYSAY